MSSFFVSGVWRCLLPIITSGNEPRASEHNFIVCFAHFSFLFDHTRITTETMARKIIRWTLLLRLQYLWHMQFECEFFFCCPLCCSQCVCCCYKCAYVPIADKYWQLCCCASSKSDDTTRTREKNNAKNTAYSATVSLHATKFNSFI